MQLDFSAFLATVFGTAVGFLGSFYLLRQQVRREFAHALDLYRRERRDREEDYRRERSDREAEYQQHQRDREAEYGRDKADREAEYARELHVRELERGRERREREKELLGALMAEMQHNTHVCREAFSGLRYGTTQHMAMAASLGIVLPERAREAIRRAYAFAGAYDDFVRSLTPEARMLTTTYDTSIAGQSAAAARQYARTSEGDFETAQQMLADVLGRSPNSPEG